MLAAAYRDRPVAPPEELSLCGSLLVQAALIAARAGDDRRPVTCWTRPPRWPSRSATDTTITGPAFGPTAVELARVAAAVELGDGLQAVARHEKAIGGTGGGGCRPSTAPRT